MTCIRLECVDVLEKVRYYHLATSLVLNTCWVGGVTECGPVPPTQLVFRTKTATENAPLPGDPLHLWVAPQPDVYWRVDDIYI